MFAFACFRLRSRAFVCVRARTFAYIRFRLRSFTYVRHRSVAPFYAQLIERAHAFRRNYHSTSRRVFCSKTFGMYYIYIYDVCMYICVTLENAIILCAIHKCTITCSSVTLRIGYMMQGCIEDFFSFAGGTLSDCTYV